VSDIYALQVKTNGDSVVTLGDLADIALTFEDRDGTSRFNGEPTVALQVVKRKGYYLIDTATSVKELVADAQKDWPEQMRATVNVGTSNDQSKVVDSMVRQLEGSVMTAIALVMIVIFMSLGNARHPACRLCNPNLIFIKLCLYGTDGRFDLEHGNVRPNFGCWHAG